MMGPIVVETDFCPLEGIGVDSGEAQQQVRRRGHGRMSEEFTHMAYLCLQSPILEPPLEDGVLLAMAHYGWLDQITPVHEGQHGPLLCCSQAFRLPQSSVVSQSAMSQKDSSYLLAGESLGSEP